MDGEAAAEGTGNGVVAAADGADVAGGATGALQVAGHGDGDVEVLGLGLGETVDSGDIVGYREVGECGTGIACADKIDVSVFLVFFFRNSVCRVHLLVSSRSQA